MQTTKRYTGKWKYIVSNAHVYAHKTLFSLQHTSVLPVTCYVAELCFQYQCIQGCSADIKTPELDPYCDLNVMYYAESD